ncbi:hypothetical protein [Streptococcus equi]|nr:hypothetical protein [Streptococcus equi]
MRLKGLVPSPVKLSLSAKASCLTGKQLISRLAGLGASDLVS